LVNEPRTWPKAMVSSSPWPDEGTVRIMLRKNRFSGTSRMKPIYIKSCETLEQLSDEIDQYMTYYNNYRYQ